MGFGTLFIGYFLLLNLTYYGYTDLIAALFMILAFYNLRTVNKYFRIAIAPASLFALVGALELCESLIRLLGSDASFLLAYTAPSRYITMGLLSVFMLLGIEDVAHEVGVSITETRAKRALPFAYVLFPLSAIFELPVTAIIGDKAAAITGFILLILVFIHVAMNLVAVYSAYMHICMPEDVTNDSREKPSRLGFVNKFREHEAERSREYAEYKLDKMKRRSGKKKGKQ